MASIAESQRGAQGEPHRPRPQGRHQTLEAISETYLQAALQQRQQRLADGLNFLNKQAPALQQKSETIQAELAAFRRQNSLLEPSLEGGALKQRETVVLDQILALETERSRLQRVRQEIDRQDPLSARGFQEAIGANSSGQGLSVSDADPKLAATTDQGGNRARRRSLAFPARFLHGARSGSPPQPAATAAAGQPAGGR